MRTVQEVAQVVPSERQWEWQQMEFYAFIHFTVNTFTDKEWGLGDEDPSLFNPTDFDADQWVEVCKSAGMKGLILTCKHHDGFCLWPSATTEHSIKNSPWKNGKGDIVREVADACHRGGIKFGVYLSPWDRHEPSYGDSDAYNALFKRQLRELLINYGDMFCVWFDGACGEGPNGKKQVYDWDGYYHLIRELQPNAVISVCGPDIRWCGNEAGHCRPSEWSVVSSTLCDNEKIQEHSQQVDDGLFAKRIRTDDIDLGSRAIIQQAEKLVWYPAEVNTSIRPGWFYHASEDELVRPLEELLKIYEGSVGGNATFLLNLPPDRRGRISEEDAKRMLEFGQAIQKWFESDLALQTTVTTLEESKGHEAHYVIDGNPDTYWCPSEGTEHASIEFHWEDKQTIDTIVLMEHIRSGQRIEAFRLEYKDETGWRAMHEGTTVGYKRICRFPEVTTTSIRVTIEESRWFPTISSIGVYYRGF